MRKLRNKASPHWRLISNVEIDIHFKSVQTVYLGMKFITQDIVAIRTFGEDVHISQIRKSKAEPVDFKPGNISNLWGTGEGSTLEDEQYMKDFYSPDFAYNFKAERPTAILLELPKGEELEYLSMSDVQKQIFYTDDEGLIYGFFIPAGVNFYIYGKKVASKTTYRKIKDHPRDNLFRQKYLEQLQTRKHDQGYKPTDLLTVEELAEFLGIARGTMYNRVSAKECPKIVKLGGSSRFQFQDVLEWVEQMKSRY